MGERFLVTANRNIEEPEKRATAFITGDAHGDVENARDDKMPQWSTSLSGTAWHFDIDKYLNQFIPPSLAPHLPSPLAHFLGYRTSPQRKIGSLIVIAWTFVGVFAGVSVVNVVGAHIKPFRVNNTATTIGSFGAAAVLEFYAFESPLAQPRNAVLGQVISSIIGVAVSKLFTLAGPARFETLRWLAGSIACAASTAVMVLTGTVHPPAGATALIAVTDDNAYQIGWYLVPAVLLGSVLMQCIALLINNIQRRYPTYWWSPEEVGQFWRRPKPNASTPDGSVSKAGDHHGSSRNGYPASADEDAIPDTGRVTFTRTRSSVQLTEVGSHEYSRVIITRNSVVVPESMYLRPEEKLVLETLSERL